MRVSKPTETISACLLVSLLLLALGGCSESRSEATTSLSGKPSTSRPDADASTMTGTFQSQGATQSARSASRPTRQVKQE